MQYKRSEIKRQIQNGISVLKYILEMEQLKQKQYSQKRISNRFIQTVTLTLEEYRQSIVPTLFSLKEIQTYYAFAPLEIAAIQTTTIETQKLRELIVDILKLTFIYDPLKESLISEYPSLPTHIGVKTILRILYRGEFFRFINNNQNQIKILINNRTTDLNVKILIAALFVLASRKLTLYDISTALLFFSLEAALNNNDSGTLPMDNQRIIKVLKKIERIIKPLEFKTWMQSVKNTKEFTGCIQPHHFLYLCSLSQKKFTKGLRYLIMQPQVSSLFKNFNINSKISQLEFKHQENEIPQERRVVRGLTFVSPRKKKENFSKQILKEFRLNNPSKNKRPDTAYLRSHVRSYCNLSELNQKNSEKQNMDEIAERLRSRQITRQVSQYNLTNSKLTKKKYEKKPELKLRIK